MDRSLRLQVIFDSLDRLSGPTQRIARGSRQMTRALTESRNAMKRLRSAERDLNGFRELRTGLADTERKWRAAQLRAQALAREIRETERPTRTMQREFRKATQEAGRLKHEFEQQSAEAEQLRRRLHDAGYSTRDFAGSERRLRGEIDRTTREMEQQQQRLERLNRARQQGARMQAMGSTIGGAGRTASLYMTTPILALGVAADRAAGEFETSMSNVGTLIDHNVENIDRMGERVLAISRRVPKPVTELADALYQVRSAGISASDQFRVLEGSSRLAVAGLGDTSEAVDLATSSINAFNLRGREQARVYDLIFRTVRAGKTTVSQLAQGFGAVAPVVANAGIQLDEYLASVAALTTTGLPAAQAHTQMRAAIAGLTRETTQSRAVFRALGARDFRDLVRQAGGVVPAFQRISRQLDGNDARIIQLVGSVEAYNAMIGLTGRNNRAYTETLRGMRSGQDALTAAFERQANSRANQRQMMRNKLFAALAQAGDRMLPALIRLVEIVGDLAEWFSNLSPGMQRAIVYGLALTAAIGPLLMGLDGIVRVGGFLLPLLTRLPGLFLGIGSAVARMGAMMLANPVVLVITAIVAVIALAAYLIWRYWDQIKAAFLTGIAPIVANWNYLRAMLAAGWAAIRSGITTAVTWVTNAWNAIRQAFSSAMSWIGSLPSRFLEMGRNLVTGLVNGIIGGARQIYERITGIGRNIRNYFANALGIRSPSRVFARLGGYITEGLDRGLDRGAAGPLSRMRRIAASIAAAGALSLSTPSFADGVTGRMNAALARGGSPSPVAGAGRGARMNHYEFHIHAQPGQDARDIAEAVREELERLERERASRRRSTYDDDEADDEA